MNLLFFALVAVVIILVIVKTRASSSSESGTIIDLTGITFPSQNYQHEFTFATSNTISFTIANGNSSLSTLTNGHLGFIADIRTSSALTNTDTITISNPTISVTSEFTGAYGGGTNPLTQIYCNADLSTLQNGSVITITTANPQTKLLVQLN